MTTPQLSEKARELIPKARIVSFVTWQDTHSSETIQCFQTADDQGRYLTDEDLQLIQQQAPRTAGLVPIAQELRDRANEIVDEARIQVLNQFPAITQPGGSLYPNERASACWRDFWHFLRCVTYGIAGHRTDYTSQEGVHYMGLLYEELQVPLDAMIVGLEGIKAASLRRLNSEQQVLIAPYFNHLIERLNVLL